MSLFVHNTLWPQPSPSASDSLYVTLWPSPSPHCPPSLTPPITVPLSLCPSPSTAQPLSPSHSLPLPLSLSPSPSHTRINIAQLFHNPDFIIEISFHVFYAIVLKAIFEAVWCVRVLTLSCPAECRILLNIFSEHKFSIVNISNIYSRMHITYYFLLNYFSVRLYPPLNIQISL